MRPSRFDGNGYNNNRMRQPYFDIELLRAAQRELQVFPNPADGQVFIKNPFEGEALVTISSLEGKTILQKTMAGNQAVFDVSKMGAGVYLVELRDAQTGSRRNGKVVVQM